jgi:septum formation protein
MSDLLLVSGSPRRRELLEMIAVPFEVFNADIDEARRSDEAPDRYALRLAREKALAGIAVKGSARPALGADTIVLLAGEILGKPVDRADARALLGRLAGATHEVYSAVCVVRPDGQSREVLSRSRVTLGSIPGAWMDAYAQLDEPMDKAGAYAIQGIAGQWVAHLEGSYSGVMGLPLFETGELLRWAGVKALSPVL